MDAPQNYNIIIGQYLEEIDQMEEKLLWYNYSVSHSSGKGAYPPSSSSSPAASPSMNPSLSATTTRTTTAGEEEATGESLRRHKPTNQLLSAVLDQCAAIASTTDQIVQRDHKTEGRFSPGSTGMGTSPTFGSVTRGETKQNIYLLYLGACALFQEAIAKKVHKTIVFPTFGHFGESIAAEEVRHLLNQSEHRIREAITLFDAEYGVHTVEREGRIRLLEVSLHEYLARCLIQKFVCSMKDDDDDDDIDGDGYAVHQQSDSFNVASHTEMQFQEMCRELDYCLKVLNGLEGSVAIGSLSLADSDYSEFEAHRALIEKRSILQRKANVLFHFAHILEQWGFQRRERYEALCEQSKEKYTAAIQLCESDNLGNADQSLFLRREMANMMMTWCKRARLMSIIYTSQRNFGRSGNASTMKGVDYLKLCKQCCQLFETIIRDTDGDPHTEGETAFLYYQFAQALMEYSLFIVPSASILPYDNDRLSIIGSSFSQGMMDKKSDLSASSNSFEKGFHKRMIEERKLGMMNLVENNDAASADLSGRSSSRFIQRKRPRKILLDFSSNPILNPRSMSAFTVESTLKREELLEKAAALLSDVIKKNPETFEAHLLIADIYFEQAAIRSLEQFHPSSGQNDFDATFTRAVRSLDNLNNLDDSEGLLESDVAFQKDQRLGQIYMFWAKAKSAHDGIEADKLYRTSLTHWYRTLRRLEAFRARTLICDYEQLLSVCQEMQNTNTLCAGFLAKKGAIVKKWKVRYVCLTRSMLNYYTAQPNTTADHTRLKKQKGGLSTLSFQKVTNYGNRGNNTLSTKRKRGYEFMFEIDTSKRTFYFGVDSEASLNRWLNALDYVMDNNESHSHRRKQAGKVASSTSFSEGTTSDPGTDSLVSPFSSVEYGDQ